MKIRRYFAENVREAIRMVRDEQGPDAVILSNTQVDGGVEIVVAIDYEEQSLLEQVNDSPVANHTNLVNNKILDTNNQTVKSRDNSLPIETLQEEIRSIKELLSNQVSQLAWSDLRIKHPNQVAVINKLMKLGLNETLSLDITHDLADQESVEYIWRHTLAKLSNKIPLSKSNILDRGGITALVGPTGVGKTTTAAKLAALYALKHGNRKVALITIDNLRVAAYEQLKVYGRIIDIPVYVAESYDELENILSDLYRKELILIDTAGVSQSDKHVISQAAILDQSNFKINKTLVLSATSQYEGLLNVINGFSVYEPCDTIVTKLDEAVKLGQVISALIEQKLAVSFVSDGQNVPQDLHAAIAHDLVARLVSYGKRSDAAKSVNNQRLTGRSAANALS